MKKCVAFFFLVFVCGCVTPIRFFMPHGPVGASKTDENEVRHSVTNTWHCYPTIWMRCQVPASQFDESNTCRHWANWIPITVIWMTVPLDGIVDTILLPWDLSQMTKKGE